MSLRRTLLPLALVAGAAVAAPAGAQFAHPAITGQLHCVNLDPPAKRVTLLFGYTSAEPGPVTIPVSGDNRLVPNPANRGQPTVFLPGEHPFVFAVRTDASAITLWSLAGKAISAGSAFQPCEDRRPRLLGDPVVGEELVATGGFPATPSPTGVAPEGFAYQWFHADTGDGVRLAPATIAGATGPTYTPVASDVGHTLAVVVRGLSDADDPASVIDGTSSAATAAVEPAPVAPPEQPRTETQTQTETPMQAETQARIETPAPPAPVEPLRLDALQAPSPSPAAAAVTAPPLRILSATVQRRSRRLRLVVAAGAPGDLAAAARIGKRTVGRARRTARAAGTLTLSLPLSKAARRGARVRYVVTLRPATGPMQTARGSTTNAR